MIKESKLELLQRYVKRGYLLHGSNKRFDVIKPFKKEKGHPTTGRMKAVYATDDPLMATFCAVKQPSKLPEFKGKRKSMIGWSYDRDGKIFVAVSPNFIKFDAFGNGWVYVLDNISFKQLKKLPHEFYSYQEIVPEKIIDVRPSDLFTNVEVNIFPVDGVRKAGFHTEEEIRFMGYDN